ncbi:Uncharacterised protein r2_g4075 [Pycnogonum litorale]
MPMSARYWIPDRLYVGFKAAQCRCRPDVISDRLYVGFKAARYRSGDIDPISDSRSATHRIQIGLKSASRHRPMSSRVAKSTSALGGCRRRADLKCWLVCGLPILYLPSIRTAIRCCLATLETLKISQELYRQVWPNRNQLRRHIHSSR